MKNDDTILTCLITGIIASAFTYLIDTTIVESDCKNYGQHQSGDWHMVCTKVLK